MNNNLPWVEKYRPINFENIISQDEIINTLNNLINNNNFPHMLFYGPPGTGKTTAILACAKKIYGSYYKSMILELNGSDDRGINIVRHNIKNFSSTECKINNIINNEKKINIKLVILDEADAMTYDAQFALRRLMEIYTDTTRFCLICNYLTKIIPALQSRCKLFRFEPINDINHIYKINKILKNENKIIKEDVIKKIVEISEGDMRKSLNLIQLIINENNIDEFTVNDLNNLIGYLSDSNIEKLKSCLYMKNIKNIIKMLNEICSNNISYQEIIRQIIIIYKSLSINDKNKLIIINNILDLSEIEINLLSNDTSTIQLYAIASIIYNSSELFNNNT